MFDLRRNNQLGQGLSDIRSAVVSGAGVEDYRTTDRRLVTAVPSRHRGHSVRSMI